MHIFCEFEQFYKDANLLINDNMLYGGMPLAVLKYGIDKGIYLKGLFEKTYLKEIIERNKIRKEEALDEISILLVYNYLKILTKL